MFEEIAKWVVLAFSAILFAMTVIIFAIMLSDRR